MKTSVPVEQQLNDLVFELDSGKGPKFLFVVCDDVTQRETAKETITLNLAFSGKNVVHLHAKSLTDGLLEALIEQSKAGTANVISIWGIENVELRSALHLFTQFNFHRDWLAKLKLPILVWITTDLLERLINAAPDFWSRRTAVYYLTKRTTPELLARLFPQKHGKSQWTPQPTLSDAFEKILTSERELGKCLQKRTSFSLTKIDGLIQSVKSGVQQLIAECEKGRQIEVALWLWNLSHLDSDLQEMLDNLGPDERIRFESLYTDRNEALLRLSEKLGTILKEYLEALDFHIRKKRKVSLVSRSRNYSISELSRMATALTSSMEMPLTPTSKIGQFVEYLPFEDDAQEKESVFLAMAAEDLESWLAGYGDRPPSFFSEGEAIILKLLYRERSAVSAIASHLGVSQRIATQKIRFLERKVRLFLGLPPRVAKTRSRKQPIRDRKTA